MTRVLAFLASLPPERRQIVCGFAVGAALAVVAVALGLWITPR